MPFSLADSSLVDTSQYPADDSVKEAWTALNCVLSLYAEAHITRG